MNTTEKAVEKKRQKRAVRTPISGRRDILTVSGKEDGFEYRWVDNNPDRLSSLQERGYEFVQHGVQIGHRHVDAGDSNVGTVVTKKAGGGKELILMRIPQEFYDEDFASKQRLVDEQEEAIKGQAKGEGRYGSIKIDKPKK